MSSILKYTNIPIIFWYIYSEADSSEYHSRVSLTVSRCRYTESSIIHIVWRAERMGEEEQYWDDN